jgi:hypothetical protein
MQTDSNTLPISPVLVIAPNQGSGSMTAIAPPKKTIPQPCTDEMLKALEVLYGPDDVIELRIIQQKGRKQIHSGYFDATSRGEMANRAKLYNVNGMAVYLTLNPVNPQLLSRCCNRIESHVSATTSDADIQKRQWLLVDIDPKRPAGTSATEAQRAAASQVAERVFEYLQSKEWPAPMVAESGNGTHLLYSLNLPNDKPTLDAINGALKGLASRFDTEVANIDTAVGNAARITKFYGTVANKGDHTEMAPWRLSRLVSIPEKASTVTLAQLLAEHPTQAAKTANTALYATSKPLSNAPFDLDGFMQRLGIPYEQDTHQGRDRYKLAHCVFNPEHGKGEAAIFREANGKPGYHCVHNSCADKAWKDVRAHVDGPPEQRRASHPPKADLSGFLEGVEPRPAPAKTALDVATLGEDERRLYGALSAIRKDAVLDSRHSASSVIGWALSHENSEVDRALGHALCQDWDAKTGGTALSVFLASNPSFQSVQPILIASLYELAKQCGWKGEMPWAEPIELPEPLPPVPPFDDRLLPESFQVWVRDIAHRMQCPPDFVAVGAIVVISSLVGAKVVVAPKKYDDWRVVPNLWGVVVGRPGVMKSPALSETLKPLRNAYEITSRFTWMN